MKKRYFIFLLLGQLVSAQNFYGSYESYNDNILETILIPLLIMIVVFTGIFYAVSYFEGVNKPEDYSTKSTNSKIWEVLGIYITSVFLVMVLVFNAKLNISLVILPAKIIGATIVSHYARKKNRNPILWWVLGFVEFHSALIVLALSKGLFIAKKVTNNADSAYNERLIKLNEMFREKLIDEEELNKKKQEAESEYRKRGYVIKQNDIQQQNNEFVSKIENAYKEGLLTEEEYQRKISKHQPINIIDEIEEEKEKLRILHSDGVISYDEMKEKFRQIEEYHKKDNS